MKYLIVFLIIGELLTAACGGFYQPRAGDHLMVRRLPASSTFKTDTGYLIDVKGCTRVPPMQWMPAFYMESETLVLDDGHYNRPHIRCPITVVRPYIQLAQ